MKKCSKCKKEYQPTKKFFNTSGSTKDGLRPDCKICRSKYYRKYYKEQKKKDPEFLKKASKLELKLYHEKMKDPKFRELFRQKSIKYRKNNPDKINALSMKRKAHKLNQTPCMSQEEKEQISDIYKKSGELGPDWQVDHIKPLSKGGLHHPDNLQIVTKQYNLKKRAKLNFRPPSNKEIYYV